MSVVSSELSTEVEELFFLFAADAVIDAAVFVFDLPPREVSELLFEGSESLGIGREELLDIRGEHEDGTVVSGGALGFQELINLPADVCGGRFPLLLEFCV